MYMALLLCIWHYCWFI